MDTNEDSSGPSWGWALVFVAAWYLLTTPGLWIGGDHAEMIRALRNQRREELIKLGRRHLKPAVQAYVRAYGQRREEIIVTLHNHWEDFGGCVRKGRLRALI